MKRIFKRILIVFVFIIALILLLFKLVFSNAYNAPELTNYNQTEFNYYQEIAKKINITSAREIKINDDLINKGLAKELEEENYYTYETSILGIDYNLKIDNLWVTISKDNMIVYGNLNLNNKHISGIKLTLDLSTDDENIYIHLKEVKIGKLPFSPKLVLKLLEKSITENFELEKDTIIVPKQYVNDKISEQLQMKIIVIDDVSLDTDSIKLSFTLKLINWFN